MPNAVVEKSFCTTREAATLLGVSVGTVQLWVENGLLDAWKTGGGHRRVVRESIERLLHKPTLRVSPAQNVDNVGATASLSRVERRVVTGAFDSTHPLRIVVVEDDPNLLRLYNTQISRWPVKSEMVGVNNGFAALLQIGRQQPDLLILDLNMPEMDGFGMLRVLRAAPEVRHTRIVVVTGMDPAAIEARGGLPADVEVLPKPVPFARLQAIAQELVVHMDLQAARG